MMVRQIFLFLFAFLLLFTTSFSDENFNNYNYLINVNLDNASAKYTLTTNLKTITLQNIIYIPGMPTKFTLKLNNYLFEGKGFYLYVYKDILDKIGSFFLNCFNIILDSELKVIDTNPLVFLVYLPKWEVSYKGTFSSSFDIIKKDNKGCINLDDDYVYISSKYLDDCYLDYEGDFVVVKCKLNKKYIDYSNLSSMFLYRLFLIF